MKLLRAHKGLLGLWKPQLLQRNFVGRSSLVSFYFKKKLFYISLK